MNGYHHLGLSHLREVLMMIIHRENDIMILITSKTDTKRMRQIENDNQNVTRAKRSIVFRFNLPREFEYRQ